MSRTPDAQPASSPSFPQPVRRRSRVYVWIGAFGAVLALLLGVGLWAVSRSLPDPTAEPGHGPAASSEQRTTGPAPIPAAPTFSSRQDQVAAFYAPGSFASTYLAHVFGGGQGERGLQTWSDQRIVASFNNWWRMGCENPAQWSQVLVGIVDAGSEFWQAHQSPPAGTCSAYFNNSAGNKAEGRTRTIRLAVGSQPGQFRPYYFAFTQDTGRNDGTGLWLLTDRNQVEGPGPSVPQPTS